MGRKAERGEQGRIEKGRLKTGEWAGGEGRGMYCTVSLLRGEQG